MLQETGWRCGHLMHGTMWLTRFVLAYSCLESVSGFPLQIEVGERDRELIPVVSLEILLRRTMP